MSAAETHCPGCGRPYVNGECLDCDGDGNPWDGRAALAALTADDAIEHIVNLVQEWDSCHIRSRDAMDGIRAVLLAHSGEDRPATE